MKLNTVDTRGRSCPEPVLMTKKALAENPKGVQVIVDNTTAKENITRYGNNAGYKVEVQDDHGDFLLSIVK